MRVDKRSVSVAVAACALSLPVLGADEDALSLKPAESTGAAAGGARVKAYAEVAAGRLWRRYGLADQDTRRASLDLNASMALTSQLRATFSSRLDDQHPVDEGGRSTLNSLREAALSWQDDDGHWAFDLGRLNVRHGPAYGFNPTDFLREGSSRAVTTADPLALRENRLGTAMVRGQWLWNSGSLSLILAPKLRDGPSRASFSADWGATNHADRALLTASFQPRTGVSLQALAMHERHKGLQVGLNGSAVFGDAMVGFFEWAGGKDTELLSAALEASPRVKGSHRAALGLTYTTSSKLSITGELEYNGFALTDAQWNQALGTYGLPTLSGYLVEAQRRQDIASRRAAMVYVSQRDAGVKNLELTGLVRFNLEDSSRFTWLEARYHFRRVDVAIQVQSADGRRNSENGALPGRRLVQLLAAYHF